MTKEGRSPEISSAERAYETLRHAIISYSFRPGYPISEMEQAKNLGMSRTPVREAIRRLTAEGLLESIPYKGTYVKVPTKGEVTELYEMSEGLEGMAAKLAAQHATEADLETLSRAIKEMEGALAREDTASFRRADEDFHNALRLASKNGKLIKALTNLREQIQRLYVITDDLNKSRSFGEHQETFEAVKNGDGERARSITQTHWARVREETIAVMP